jgi:predicted component of type VI protein secretion system
MGGASRISGRALLQYRAFPPETSTSEMTAGARLLTIEACARIAHFIAFVKRDCEGYCDDVRASRRDIDA